MEKRYLLIESSELLQMVRNAVREEMTALQPKDEDKMLNTAEACKCWQPAITRQTLDSYVQKGYITRHFFGKKPVYSSQEIKKAAKEVRLYKPGNSISPISQ